MTDIKKMFENANAYKMLCNCEFKNLFDYSIGYGQDVCIHAEDEIRRGCEGCELAEQNVKYYPPFTAEKQIELIKWLIGNKRLFITKADYSSNYYMDVAYNRGNGVDNPQFESCLASLINELWQSLTDQEKEEIRGILND